MTTPKKPTRTRKARAPHVEGDARERGWRNQHERRKKQLGSRDLVRLKPSTLEGLETLMDADGEESRAAMVTKLVEDELKRRERRR